MVNDYFLLKGVEESCNHGLLYCLRVHKLWIIVYGLLGINWVMTGNMRDEIWIWKSINSGKKQVGFIPLAIF